MTTTEPTFNPWAGFDAAFGDTPAPAARPATAAQVAAIAGPVDTGDDFEIPRNALTGAEYRGRNIPRLLVAAAEHGYNGPEWAGFTQWRKLGRTVRKGEHGTACLTVVTCDDGKTRPRGFKVFHRDQTGEIEAAEGVVSGDYVAPTPELARAFEHEVAQYVTAVGCDEETARRIIGREYAYWDKRDARLSRMRSAGEVAS